jgi:hypothetical protein
MQDHELYRRILGVEAPWYVDSVELKQEVGEIHVRLAHHDMINWPCPESGTECKLYDHQPERQWRHLDTCQYHHPARRAAPQRVRRARSASGEDAVGGAFEPIQGAV